MEIKTIRDGAGSEGVHGAPPPLCEVAKAAVPGGIDALIRSLLDKDPDRRPPSSLAVIAALEAIALAADEAWPTARARVWWTTHHALPASMSAVSPMPSSAAIAISDPLLA